MLKLTPVSGKYPMVRLGSRVHRVYRVVALTFMGATPIGFEVCHGDDNGEDSHLSNLYFGTHSDNMRDKVRNGKDHFATRLACGRGHEYTPENTYRAPGDSTNRRQCRECKRMWRLGLVDAN